MGVKQFIDGKTKKLGKSERVDFIRDNISSVVEFYVKRGFREQDKVNAIYDKLAEDSILASIEKYLKAAKKDEFEIDLGIAVLVGDFLERRGNKLPEKVFEGYTGVINSVLKKKVKVLSKKLGIEPDIIKEMLVVVPDDQFITDGRFIGYHVLKMLRKLYIIAKDNDLGIDDAKKLGKMFKKLFNEDLLGYVALNVLLERKDTMKNFNESQMKIWNLLTTFALDVLNTGDKEAVRKHIEFYIDRRSKEAEKNKDMARRISLTGVSPEDYKKLAKVVEKLAEKGKNKNFL